MAVHAFKDNPLAGIQRHDCSFSSQSGGSPRAAGSPQSPSRRHQTPQSADHIKSAPPHSTVPEPLPAYGRPYSSASFPVQTSEGPHHPLQASGVPVPLKTPSDRPSALTAWRQVSSSNVCAFQIPYMYFRNCIQIYVPVNAGEPVKILILAPAACGPFKHLCGKLTFFPSLRYGVSSNSDGVKKNPRYSRYNCHSATEPARSLLPERIRGSVFPSCAPGTSKYLT